MAEPTTPRGADPDLRSELDASRQEIERLRNLLLERDVELGEVRGQLAFVEHQTQQLINLAGRVQARLPWLASIARAVVRKLRSLRRG
jgi:hypothetical protein